MEQSKRMADHFIRLGYFGRLTFRWRDREDGEPVAFECSIWLFPDRRATIVIERDEEYLRSYGDHAAPIVEVCEQLGLPESK
jgi:hypothetical protein